jgi:hypothetical protein
MLAEHNFLGRLRAVARLPTCRGLRRFRLRVRREAECREVLQQADEEEGGFVVSELRACSSAW